MSMDEYKKSLKTYNEISDSRKEEAKSRGEREGKAIQHLRNMLMPEIKDLIQRQRLKYLVNGSKFNKYKREGGKDRGKYVYCKLSNNHKSLHYGDWRKAQMRIRTRPIIAEQSVFWTSSLNEKSSFLPKLNKMRSACALQ